MGDGGIEMENVMVNKAIAGAYERKESARTLETNLAQAQLNLEYTIKNIDTNDEELEGFLFTLGCYEGEQVTVISILSENYVISVKDARYSIDRELAEAILI